MINNNRPVRRTSRTVTGVLVSALAIFGVVIPATPAVAEPECLHPSYDFDGDHQRDPVIGIPGGGGRAGAVEVRISNEGDERIVRIKGPSGFGSAVGELSSYQNEGDDRLCSQLVVGSPHETVDGKADAGAVYVYTFDGDRFVRRGRYAPGVNGVPGSPQAGARFGAAVASQPRMEEEIDPQPRRLYVGAPGQDVGSAKDAGRVTSFVLGAGDAPRASAGKVISYATSGVPGAPTTGGALGSAIAVSHGVAALGAPGQAVGGVTGGAVLMATQADTRFFQVSQATPRVPGSVERGDRLGAAVTLSGFDGDSVITLMVGVPGEDLGSVSNAGSVLDIPIRVADGAPVPEITAYHQGTGGIVGKAEAGDGFGSAISVTLHVDIWMFFIGVPGEDIDGHRDAGMVQVLGEDYDQGISQSSRGIPGSNEAGDRFGASVAGWTIGVPGENGGDGAVVHRGPDWSSPSVRWTGPSGDADRYGFALAP